MNSQKASLAAHFVHRLATSGARQIELSAFFKHAFSAICWTLIVPEQ